MRLILVALLLLTACSSPPAPAPVEPLAWTTEAAPTLPRERLETVYGATGWSGGFVLAGWYGKPAAPNEEGRTNDLVQVLHMSADGRTWREVTPPDIGGFAFGDALAAYGDRAYALGANGASPTLLTSEGGVWTKLKLPGGLFTDVPTSVSAGPRGVVVAAFTDKRADRAGGLRIWHSADGVHFGEPVVLTKKSLSNSYLPRVVETERGFLVYGAMPSSGLPKRQGELLFESENGRDWQAVGDKLPDLAGGQSYGPLTAAQHNNGVTVLFGSVTSDNADDQEAGLTGWYRRDGDSSWTKLADIDPGRLPDAGVVPKVQRKVRDVAKRQTGFIAIGTASADAAVWTSPDGLTWTKMPVRDNGFEGAGALQHLSDGSLTLLLGSTLTGPAQFWRSGTPGPRPDTNQPVAKGGAWQGILGMRMSLDDKGDGELGYSDFKVTDRKEFVVKFRHVGMTAGGTRTLEITSSNDPVVPVGGRLSAKVETNGPTVLFPDGTQREFCGDDRYAECS